MDDFPAKIADLLESVAAKVRSLTTERVATWAVWTAIGIVLTMMGLAALVFLLIALFRVVALLVSSVTAAYAIVGGLFVIVGALLWRMRNPKAVKEN